MMIDRVFKSFQWHFEHWIKLPIYKAIMPYKVRKMRSKKIINVLFIITEIGPWKTKELYKAMLKHPRFNPILGISESMEIPSAKKEVIDSLVKSGFDFVDLDVDSQRKKMLSSDIVFYQKPYASAYQPYLYYLKHLKSLFCYVYYAFRLGDISWSINQPLFSCVWQQYFENNLTATPKRLALMKDGGKQAVITGLPIQDQLLQPKENYEDPWKSQAHTKKRIIYAPHHTIGSMHMKGLALSTFLENGEIMLELMHKYSDKVQWAFKPHPLLYKNLIKVWGKERADSYYDEWKNSDNSQFEDGEYDALFKYSDAMIHDCSSFTAEYHFTMNPVMYLIRENGMEVSYNDFGQQAFDLHYKGYTKDDIEHFIQDVINGNDPLKQKRKQFFDNYLIPPYGKTACENIINAILGQEEYKEKTK